MKRQNTLMNIENNTKQKLLHHYHKLSDKHQDLEIIWTKCRGDWSYLCRHPRNTDYPLPEAWEKIAQGPVDYFQVILWLITCEARNWFSSNNLKHVLPRIYYSSLMTLISRLSFKICSNVWCCHLNSPLIEMI